MPHIEIFAPVGGYNRATQPGFLELTETPDSQDVRYWHDAIEKRLGYTSLSASVGSSLGSSVGSVPMLLYDFLQLSGTRVFVAVTTGQIWKYSAAGWTSIKSSLTGTVSDYYSATVMNDTLIISNGVDAVQSWDGSAASTSDLSGATDYQLTGTTHIAKVVVQFADRLLVMNSTEDGITHPQRVRWSELGKTDEWDTTQGGGFADLVEDPGPILGAKLLGNQLAIYKKHSIVVCSYIGGAVTYVFNTVIPELGCPSPRTIQNVGGIHLFMSEDDIYEFNGSDVQPLGEPVRDEIFTGMARDDAMKAHATINREENLYLLYAPVGNNTPTKAYPWDYKRRIWQPPYTWGMTASADVELGSGLTWGTIPELTWSAVAAPSWNAWGAGAGEHYITMADAAGVVYQHDGQTLNDNATAIDGYYQTPDVAGDKEYVTRYKRWTKLTYEARGNTVDISYSTDSGATWTWVESDTLDSAWSRQTVYFDASSRQIRFRFRNNTASERFWVRWLRVDYELGGWV